MLNSKKNNLLLPHYPKTKVSKRKTNKQQEQGQNQMAIIKKATLLRSTRIERTIFTPSIQAQPVKVKIVVLVVL